MPSITLSGTEIPFKIVPSEKRKTKGISVERKQGLVVTAPQQTENNEIEKLLKVKEKWILEKLEKMDQIHADIRPIEFVSVPFDNTSTCTSVNYIYRNITDMFDQEVTSDMN